MLKRFISITFVFLVLALFAFPFCIMYLIWIGYPESAVDLYYWSRISILWLIVEMFGYLEWRIHK